MKAAPNPKIKEPTETILNRQFLFIANNNHPNIAFMIRLNSGSKIEEETRTTKRRCIRYGTPGYPDLDGMTRWGQKVACETKRPSTIGRAIAIEKMIDEGKPIPFTKEAARLRLQKMWRDTINRGGGVAFLASSVEEFRAKIDSLKPPPGWPSR